MALLRTHWQVLFFHQHRMAHLPRVYEQAHKLHHYLHDCSPFDAHLYGSGLPEEWCLLVFEVAVAAGFGVLPPALSFNVLANDWGNKVGHTRKADASDGANYHADHHTLHNKNFGIYGCLLTCTLAPTPLAMTVEYAGCVITRKQVQGGTAGAPAVVFHVAPKPGPQRKMACRNRTSSAYASLTCAARCSARYACTPVVAAAVELCSALCYEWPGHRSRNTNAHAS